MPATSKKQQRFMAMLEHNPGMAKKKGIHMTHQQLHDFATTKTSNLPEKVKKSKTNKRKLRK